MADSVNIRQLAEPIWTVFFCQGCGAIVRGYAGGASCKCGAAYIVSVMLIDQPGDSLVTLARVGVEPQTRNCPQFSTHEAHEWEEGRCPGVEPQEEPEA